jgi:hypothetical protein
MSALLAGLRKAALFFSVVALAGCLVDAQKDYSRRLQFARGQHSAKVENSVVRGTRDYYVVGAKAGQAMTVNLSSVEHNAVFSIAQPDGKSLPHAAEEDDATHWTGKLPQTGDFMITVGGTRGNAKYVLTVSIK